MDEFDKIIMEENAGLDPVSDAEVLARLNDELDRLDDIDWEEA